MRKIIGTVAFTMAFAGLAFAANPKVAPDFSLVTIQGDTVKLSSLVGKVVIIDFWATWCPPCRKGIPGFVELKKKYGDKIEIIGISVDNNVEKVKSFYKEQKMNFPVGMATRDIIDKYNSVRTLQYIPTTFIVDKKGNIFDVRVGYTDKAEFERIIKTLLSSK